MNGRFLYLSSIVVALVGFVDSIYLTWVKLAQRPVFCGAYGGCDTVNSSPYAVIGGIPIAILGAGAYLTILMLLYLEKRDSFWRDNGPLMIFGISLAGVLYSAYLTYIEIAVLRAICPYCVLSAIAILLLLIFAILRLVRGQVETNPI